MALFATTVDVVGGSDLNINMSKKCSCGKFVVLVLLCNSIHHLLWSGRCDALILLNNNLHQHRAM